MQRATTNWPGKGTWLLLLLVLSLAFQGSRGLWEPDEGRYTDVALEMLRFGDYITPALHHELPHFTKPPLTYWTLASSIAAFGRNEWAVRLPLSLAFVATVLLVYGIGKRLVPALPWLPALVYATSLMPFVSSNIVSTDTLLTLWETMAVFGFIALWWGEDPARWPVDRMVLWGGFGLAFLSKGPPALLPLLAILAFAALTRKAKSAHRPVPRLVTPLSLLLFLLVGGTWFVMVIILNPGLLGYFLHYEIVDRMFTSVHERNPEWYGAFKVYLPTFLLGTIPWIVPVGAGLRRAPRLVTPRFWRSLRRDDPDLLFLLLWFLGPLAIFALARSRLPLYVLPLFVPLSVLIGRWLAPWAKRTLARAARPGRRITPRTALTVGLGIWMVALVGLKATAAHLDRPEDSRRMARAIEAQVLAPYSEVAFFDERPRYGLSLYLDVEIERLELVRHETHTTSHHLVDTLEDEMTEGENPLYVLDVYEADMLELRARDVGRRAVEQGRFEDYVFYTLVPRNK